MADNVYVDVLRTFIVFNDGDLSMEPISDEDLTEVSATDQKLKNVAWSCNINWFFVVLDSGILLMSVASDKAILCRKKSAMFIEEFLNAPHGKKKKRAGKGEDNG